MKAILVTLFISFISTTQATTYYFSSASGNDARSSSEAQNSSTPWKTLSKLNSFFSTLKPGDAVLLKRGETFYGSIAVTKSGTSGAPIVIGAYGTGNNPVITSLQTLGGWVSKGSGIWESSNTLGSTLNMVLINGVEYGIGRYPNKDAVNGGYLNFESHSGKTSITDNQLSSSINWKGADVIIRPRHWILSKNLITAHSGNKISYSTTSPYEPYENYGYFVQNSIKTLDKFGEWYYNPSSKKLSVYFGSNSPSSFSLQATTLSDLVSSVKFSYITFQYLTLRGSNGSGFDIQNGSHISIENCSILFSGLDGIYVRNHTYLKVQNCTISDQNNNGIDIETGDNATIRNNKISNTYLITGMGRNGEGMGIGININSTNAMVEYNEIRNTGYSGIYFNGSNITLKNNLIDNFCSVKDDGGGVYSTKGKITFTGRKVIGNIILNGKGIGYGTNDNNKLAAHGLYLDNNAGATDFRDNTIANCSNNGVNIHNSAAVTMVNNNIYNNKIQVNMVQDADNVAIRNCVLDNNILFSKLSNQWVTMMMASGNDIKSFGKFDNNIYARPLDNNIIIYTKYYYQTNHDVTQNFSLAGWKAKYGMDVHSKTMTKQLSANSDPDDYIRFEYNASTSNKTINLNGSYADARGANYSNSISLKPYTSVVLVKTSGVIGNSAPTATITSPVTNSTFPANTIVLIDADAYDDDAVAKVEFYNGSNLLASDNTSPYSYSWNNVASGKYTLTVKATDKKGLSSTSSPVTISVSGISNGAPTISVTSPSDNAIFTSPASISITAAASDPGGSIAKVDFYNGASLLGTDQSSPYSFAWNNVIPGDYDITAKATDNTGITTTSASVAVSVKIATGTGVPTVNIITPQNNASYSTPAIIFITAAASDADGSIKKVEFFNGTTLLKTESTAPYNYNWTNVPIGDYVLTARATDDDGLTTTSAAHLVSVTAVGTPTGGPVVNMTTPGLHASYTAPATVTLSATAFDANGSISKVEFFNGATLLNTQKTAPYTFVWNNVPVGSYNLTAKATDNDGLTASSAINLVSVTTQGSSTAVPIVSIISPIINATYTAPATVTLTAEASDANGSISKVEFYNGATLLNIQRSAPYTYIWENVAAGSYTITAKATDNNGFETTSPGVSIAVNAQTAARSSSTGASTSGGVSISTPYATGIANSKQNYKDKFPGKTNATKAIHFRLYPNPAVRTIRLYFDRLPVYQKAGLLIYNAAGSVIKQYPVIITGNQLNVDISTLNNGIYIISLTGYNFTVNRKFFKTN